MRENHCETFEVELQQSDCSQLLHLMMANASTIRGVSLPEGKTAKQCHVADLRDFIAARGGNASLYRMRTASKPGEMTWGM